MPIYNAPLADMKFILNDVFNAEKFWQANENLAHVDAATAEAILEEMAKFAQSGIVLIDNDSSGSVHMRNALQSLGKPVFPPS